MIKQVINLPGADEELKHIQLYIKREPYLFCDSPEKFHSIILAETLKSFNLEFEEIERGKPKKEGKDYKLVGAGQICKFRDEFRFFGKSWDYDISTDKEHLEKIKPYLPKGIEIEVLNF